MIFNSKYETMTWEDIQQLQTERLQSTLNRVYRNVAFYKNKFDECKIDIEKIQGVEDIKHIPFTVKEDLRQSYPYDMFAVPLRDIIRIHSSSGTTGKPIVVGYTKNDLNHWSEIVARLLCSVGVTDNDFVQIALDYSLFTGGFGFHGGAEKIGAGVIPSSSDTNIEKQLYIMKDYKTSVLISTPGYAITLASYMAEMGLHPEELHLKVGLFGAEPWSEELRHQIEDKLHIQAYDNYGLSEIMGPGISGECEQKNGLHINEDQFLVEVIDPKTGKSLGPGETGELVITNLFKEGCPLIRYRTGDLASLLPGTCSCGRTLTRMSRVTGRTDNVLIFKGIKIMPSQIEEVLLKAENIKPHYRILNKKEGGSEELEIQVEVSKEILFDEVKKMLEMKNNITRRLQDELGIEVKISFVEPRTLRNLNNKK
ncbi:MAG: phenylacetate--CoA ligase [Spirochaetes bacterium]|nr:phenylacetate--CoA ligase [Spirochaetota bacterium]